MDEFNQIDKDIKSIKNLEVNKKYVIKNFERIDSLIIVELDNCKIVLPKRFSKLDDYVIKELNEMTNLKLVKILIGKHPFIFLNE